MLMRERGVQALSLVWEPNKRPARPEGYPQLSSKATERRAPVKQWQKPIRLDASRGSCQSDTPTLKQAEGGKNNVTKELKNPTRSKPLLLKKLVTLGTSHTGDQRSYCDADVTPKIVLLCSALRRLLLLLYYLTSLVAEIAYFPS